MSKINKKIAFLGAGNMAEAMIAGLVKSGLVPSKNIIVSDVSRERLSYLKKKYTVRAADSNTEAVKSAATIILSVKPQVMEQVLCEIGADIKSSQLVISIAAGVTTRYIEKYLKAGTPVVRTMPNTPLMAGAGATAVCKGLSSKKTHINESKKIFSVSGSVVEVTEDKINAITALSGSGPAYVFYLAEMLKDAGVEMGLKEDIADELSRQTIYGAGKMLKEQNVPASEMRKKVTSPGGTTEAAITYLDKKSFSKIFKDGVKQAKKRAGSLSK